MTACISSVFGGSLLPPKRKLFLRLDSHMVASTGAKKKLRCHVCDFRHNAFLLVDRGMRHMHDVIDHINLPCKTNGITSQEYWGSVYSGTLPWGQRCESGGSAWDRAGALVSRGSRPCTGAAAPILSNNFHCRQEPDSEYETTYVHADHF